MTGFQNTTDSLSFVVGQLGYVIDLKINTVTKRCERVGAACVPPNHNVHCSTKPKGGICLLVAEVDTVFWL